MGVLAPGSAYARPSARPPSTLAEIVRRTCFLGRGVKVSQIQKILSTFHFLKYKSGSLNDKKRVNLEISKVVKKRLCRHVRRKISASVDGGRAEGLASADPVARTPVGHSENFLCFYSARGRIQANNTN